MGIFWCDASKQWEFFNNGAKESLQKKKPDHSQQLCHNDLQFFLSTLSFSVWWWQESVACLCTDSVSAPDDKNFCSEANSWSARTDTLNCPWAYKPQCKGVETKPSDCSATLLQWRGLTLTVPHLCCAPAPLLSAGALGAPVTCSPSSCPECAEPIRHVSMTEEWMGKNNNKTGKCLFCEGRTFWQLTCKYSLHD